MAKEFYEPLPCHASWPYVTWKFITDPQVGMWCRAKRLDRGEKIDPVTWTQQKTVDEEQSDTLLSREMDEAVERGYGSDRD